MSGSDLTNKTEVKESMHTKQMTIRLDAATHKRLKLYAVECETSIQKLIEKAIRSLLAEPTLEDSEESKLNSRQKQSSLEPVLDSGEL